MERIDILWVAYSVLINLHRIVYLSTATKILSDDEVGALAMRAAARNKLTGLGGILLFDGARFIQVLEGTPFHLDATMKKIARDPRHTDITIAEHARADRRCFGDWSLRYHRVGDDGRSDDFVREIAEAAQGIPDLKIKAMLIGFAALRR